MTVLFKCRLVLFSVVLEGLGKDTKPFLRGFYKNHRTLRQDLEGDFSKILKNLIFVKSRAESFKSELRPKIDYHLFQINT